MFMNERVIGIERVSFPNTVPHLLQIIAFSDRYCIDIFQYCLMTLF